MRHLDVDRKIRQMASEQNKTLAFYGGSSFEYAYNRGCLNSFMDGMEYGDYIGAYEMYYNEDGEIIAIEIVRDGYSKMIDGIMVY